MKKQDAIFRAQDMIRNIREASSLSTATVICTRTLGYLEALRDTEVLTDTAYEALRERAFNAIQENAEKIG